MLPSTIGSKRRSGPNQPTSSSVPETAHGAQLMDDFSARRSGRVATGQCVADNDTWVEALAVCEAAKDPKKTNTTTKGPGLLTKLRSKSSMNGNENADLNIQQQHEAQMALAAQRLTLRPYFQSQNTGQRVWDEPPSGASNIIYATAESRKMAHAQLEEMRATYAEASLIRKSKREEAAALERSFAEKKGSSKKLSLPKIFKRSSSSTSEAEARNMSTPLVASSNTNSARTGIPSSVLEESVNLATDHAYEQDLQMAMMFSMGIGEGSVMGVGNHTTPNASAIDNFSSDFASANNCTPAAAARREMEQIEMAKALSLAEEKARSAPVDNCKEKTSNKPKKQQYVSLKSDGSEQLQQRPVQSATAAPTMNQIESAFNGSFNCR